MNLFNKLIQRKALDRLNKTMANMFSESNLDKIDDIFDKFEDKFFDVAAQFKTQLNQFQGNKFVIEVPYDRDVETLSFTLNEGERHLHVATNSLHDDTNNSHSSSKDTYLPDCININSMSHKYDSANKKMVFTFKTVDGFDANKLKDDIIKRVSSVTERTNNLLKDMSKLTTLENLDKVTTRMEKAFTDAKDSIFNKVFGDSCKEDLLEVLDPVVEDAIEEETINEVDDIINESEDTNFDVEVEIEDSEDVEVVEEQEEKEEEVTLTDSAKMAALHLGGMSYREIGKRFGISDKTVKRRIENHNQSLR